MFRSVSANRKSDVWRKEKIDLFRNILTVTLRALGMNFLLIFATFCKFRGVKSRYSSSKNRQFKCLQILAFKIKLFFHFSTNLCGSVKGANSSKTICQGLIFVKINSLDDGVRYYIIYYLGQQEVFVKVFKFKNALIISEYFIWIFDLIFFEWKFSESSKVFLKLLILIIGAIWNERKKRKICSFFSHTEYHKIIFFYFILIIMSRNLSITEGWEFGPGLTLLLPFFLKATYQ